MDDKVRIILYRWAGSWGPFRIRIPCGECSLTRDVIQDTINNELSGVHIDLEIKDWLDIWWEPLLKGGWHAPIVMVNNRVISQGVALNRGVLTQAVIEDYSIRIPLEGNHLYGKETCPYCKRAKGYLQDAGIPFSYHDVIKSPRALYEMLARVKPIIGPRTPVTVPQIWIDGEYVGGADQLSAIVHQHVELNPERGRCSISETRK